MSDGTTKPIEQVKVGDLVLSKNEQTGEVAPKKVTNTSVRPDIWTRKLTLEVLLGQSYLTRHTKMAPSSIEARLLLYALALHQADWFRNSANPLYNGPWYHLVSAMRFGEFTPSSLEKLLSHLQRRSDFNEGGFSILVEEDQVCFPPDPPQIPKRCFAMEGFFQALQNLQNSYQEAVSQGVNIRKGLLSIIGTSELARATQLQVLGHAQQPVEPQVAQCWEFFLKFAPRLDVETVELLLEEFKTADEFGYWNGMMADEELNLTRKHDLMYVSLTPEECNCSYRGFMNELEKLLRLYQKTSFNNI